MTALEHPFEPETTAVKPQKVVVWQATWKESPIWQYCFDSSGVAWRPGVQTCWNPGLAGEQEQERIRVAGSEVSCNPTSARDALCWNFGVGLA